MVKVKLLKWWEPWFLPPATYCKVFLPWAVLPLEWTGLPVKKVWKLHMPNNLQQTCRNSFSWGWQYFYLKQISPNKMTLHITNIVKCWCLHAGQRLLEQEGRLHPTTEYSCKRQFTEKICVKDKEEKNSYILRCIRPPKSHSGTNN